MSLYLAIAITHKPAACIRSAVLSNSCAKRQCYEICLPRIAVPFPDLVFASVAQRLFREPAELQRLQIGGTNPPAKLGAKQMARAETNIPSHHTRARCCIVVGPSWRWHHIKVLAGGLLDPADSDPDIDARTIRTWSSHVNACTQPVPNIQDL